MESGSEFEEGEEDEEAALDSGDESFGSDDESEDFRPRKNKKKSSGQGATKPKAEKTEEGASANLKRKADKS